MAGRFDDLEECGAESMKALANTSTSLSNPTARSPEGPFDCATGSIEIISEDHDMVESHPVDGPSPVLHGVGFGGPRPAEAIRLTPHHLNLDSVDIEGHRTQGFVLGADTQRDETPPKRGQCFIGDVEGSVGHETQIGPSPGLIGQDHTAEAGQPRPIFGRLPWLAFERRSFALRFLVFLDMACEVIGNLAGPPRPPRIPISTPP